MTGEQTGACPLAGPRPGSRRLHVPNTHSRMEAMPFTHPSLSLLISSVLAASAALATQTREKSASGSVVPGRANEAFANLPLYFEPNQGQTEGQVKFLSRGAAHTLFLTHSKAVLLVTRIERGPVESWNSEPQTSGTVLGMSFIGASRNPQVLGQEELPGRVNYLVGSNPRTWRTNIATYARVTYRDLYPGIDLTYYGREGQLEYDFVVRPGADLRRILVDFSGAEKLEVDARGDLVLRTGPDVIRQRKPIAYQEVNGIRREIPVSYVLKGAHRVAFKVAAHDSGRPLIIDPALFYSTYLGGSIRDGGQGIAVDSAGNAYVTGLSNSPDFPTATGAFQGTLAGSFDAFVTKINPVGSAPLVYSTYLGGSGDDYGLGIAVDAAGNAYVTGFTSSTNFPHSVAAFQTTLAGSFDAFVTKLNLAGSAPLLYSTYLGGESDNRGYAVAVDGSGNAYVTGYTTSTKYPTTTGAFQSAFGGGINDAFVTRLNPSGSAPLVYSTYLGGSGDDASYGIALDGSDDAYLTGYTASANFPTTAGVFQTTFAGGRFDAFVTKLNPAGSAPLVYSTYLGGTGDDAGQAIAVDGLFNAYVTGFTGSTNFPTTAGAFQTRLRGSVFNAFVTKIAEVQLDQCPADGQGDCEQTGGEGTVDDSDNGNQGEGAFSFIVRRPSTTQAISGGLQFVNPANGTDARSVTLGSLVISGNSAIVAGTCTNSGAPCTFVADVTDSGPTGSGDTFTISISGGPARGGPLRSGKIQVRPR